MDRNRLAMLSLCGVLVLGSVACAAESGSTDSGAEADSGGAEGGQEDGGLDY